MPNVILEELDGTPILEEADTEDSQSFILEEDQTGFQEAVAIGNADGSARRFLWTLTTATPTGAALAFPEWADCTLSVLATGTTLGGAVAALQTAPQDVDADFATCKSAAGGAAMALSAAPSSATAIERSIFVRPVLTTVGVGAIVVVELVIRRPNPLRT